MSSQTDARLDELLEVLARASVGDADARVDVGPHDLDDPIVVIGNAVNLLLDDLAYRQRERERALLAAREAATKEELLSYLSHDMQTPLSLLLGTLALLDDSPEPEEVATAVPIMRRAATRLQRFVSQFLDLARLGAERPLLVELSAVDLHEVAERTVALFTQRAEVPVELPDDIPAALADGDRVEQILANLVGNALTYSGPGATVRITGHATADGRVAVQVVDDGVGMTEDDLRFAFDRYERGSRASGTSGTGLGLYLSRALAEAQHGTLEVESQPGSGCCFTLTLPAA